MKSKKFLMNNCPNCGNKENRLQIKEGDFLIVKCTACGLIYLLNPPADEEIYEDYYQIPFKGSDYTQDSQFDFLREIFEINQQRVQLLKKLLPDIKNKSFLDIGCGSGLFLKTLKDHGLSGEGIDISENALKFARENFILLVHNKKPDELVSENKKYDVITLWHVLEHFENPVELLKKVYMLLNNDGYLFIEVPNHNSIKFRLSGYKWKGGNHPKYHRVFFTAKTLKNTLELSGFNNITKLNFSYNLQTKGAIYNITKKFFNTISADAFLNFSARK